MFKQWAAGAPVIGAAPVSSGRPKRPRSEGLSDSGALQFFSVWIDVKDFSRRVAQASACGRFLPFVRYTRLQVAFSRSSARLPVLSYRAVTRPNGRRHAI